VAVKTVVVIGASVAGVAAVESIRAAGYAGRLVLLDADHDQPYDRPPLSKDVLTGGMNDGDIVILSRRRAADLDVELRLGERARRLDPASRTISTEMESIGYDG